MNTHVDARRTFYGNVFPLAEGSLNIVHVNFDTPYTERHRHQDQDDWFFMVSGVLRFELIDPLGEMSRVILDARMPYPFRVPAQTWHHYTCLTYEGATYVMWASKAYDAVNPDEEREPLDAPG